MISVERVYTSVKDISNKEQKGFITPVVFNTFAHMAQMNVYNELFSDLAEAKKLSRQGLDPSFQSSFKKQSYDDLSVFVDEFDVTASPTDLPADFNKIISVYDDSFNYCDIEYDIRKKPLILTSHLSGGTGAHPVCFLSDGSIEIYNNSDNVTTPGFSAETYTMTYYRVPVRPYYSYITFQNNSYTMEQFDAENSINFELPAKYENELVAEILKLIGVRLRDSMVLQFGSTEELAQ